MLRGSYNIVIGGQAGSESKGKLAAYIVDKFKPEVLVMAASPNAGHTAIVGGHKYVTYHLPVSWVANRTAHICLGPTSVIHLPTLLREINTLQIPEGKLHIHPRAVMVREFYIAQEREHGLLKIGSTNQGVGIARREKLMRVDDITFAKDVGALASYTTDTVDFINDSMEAGNTVLCEMTQGYDLCLEHGIDSHYCTSKMVNPAMALAEAGVSPHLMGDVYGVFRPYPIRVNNREGSSGPYADAAEITWKDVAKRSGYTEGDLTELTTTTKLPRRVFEFSKERFRKFIQICAPTHLCLQFANYVDADMFKVKKESDISRKLGDFLAEVENIADTPVSYIGTGPDHEDMIDCGLDQLADV